MVGGGDRETDGADARVEVEDCVGGDVTFDFCEGHFVDREVDLKESVGGIGILVTHNGIGEKREDWVRFVVLKEAAGDFALLITS